MVERGQPARQGGHPTNGPASASPLGRVDNPVPYGVCIVCPPSGPGGDLLKCLALDRISYSLSNDGTAAELPGGVKPDVLLVDLTEADRPTADLMLRRSAGQGMPVIAALAAEHLQSPDLKLMTSDFIVAPWHRGELSWRIRRQVTAVAPPDAPGIIGVGDLTIDTNRYDVYLAGKTVVLTFKEYQLLKLLASNPGRAFTRETLLEQVWGYEYFGGTRTVDVHIRRLRSKIEDATHTFVDTVWNVGYRFRG